MEVVGHVGNRSYSLLVDIHNRNRKDRAISAHSDTRGFLTAGCSLFGKTMFEKKTKYFVVFGCTCTCNKYVMRV